MSPGSGLRYEGPCTCLLGVDGSDSGDSKQSPLTSVKFCPSPVVASDRAHRLDSFCKTGVGEARSVMAGPDQLFIPATYAQSARRYRLVGLKNLH